LQQPGHVLVELERGSRKPADEAADDDAVAGRERTRAELEKEGRGQQPQADGKVEPFGS